MCTLAPALTRHSLFGNSSENQLSTNGRRWIAAAAMLTMLLAGASLMPAQTPPATQNPDAKIVESVPEKHRTVAEITDQAWSILNEAITDERHPDQRVQSLAALGSMGSTMRSLKMIQDAMQDKDLDVRIASVLAAGKTQSSKLTEDLRHMLDDKEPGVAFTAAMTLWKNHDHSGEDIVMAVADGERGTSSTFINGTTHHISKDLHHPGAMARFGAMQGAYMMLGPFGYGLTAYEYLHKNGGDAARVSAIDAIGQSHTEPVRQALLAALLDKDLGVRAAAAQALAHYHEPAVAVELAKLFDDPKPPVRYTAAAAYLISTRGATASPVERSAEREPSDDVQAH